MQLRFACDLTGAEYVSQQAWHQASLPQCPLHPEGGCGFARHGTYGRVTPPGTRIARWYCRQGHRTFSLLPDCLAARLPGTLAEVEAAVRVAEAASSREAACDHLRQDIELPGALRWLMRRWSPVHLILHLLKGLLPDLCPDCPPTLTAFAAHLGVALVLVALRGIAVAWLASLPKPLGFQPRRSPGGGRHGAHPHPVGADPPRRPG